MNTSLFWMLLMGLQGSCLWVGYRATKKQRTQGDYYLAGRSLTFFPLLMTFVATQVGGGLILGSAEEAYRVGWKIIYYPLGAVSGFLLLSCGLGRRLADLPISTVAQIFEVVYGSRTLKQVASAISVITLFLIVVAQVIASQKFMASINLRDPMYFYFFWGIVLLYTMWGGMEGIASIDMIQASFLLLTFGLSWGVAVYLNPGLPVYSQISSQTSSRLSSHSWVGWFLMPCLFMVIEQDMAQRCFSARSPAVIKKAALAAASLIFLVSLIPIYFGLYGLAGEMTALKGCSILMAVVQKITSPTISAMVACAVMMAITSSAVSVINSVSSNLTQDFGRPWEGWCSPLLFSKGVTLGVGLSAIGVSTWFENIVSLLIQSYELYVVCLFVPVFAALFRRELPARAASLSMTFGALSFLLFRLIPSVLPKFFPQELIEIGASGIGFMLGSVGRQFGRSGDLERVRTSDLMLRRHLL